ncbi:MAG: indolepyruvate ferredoxin oxidoreductase subunit alpha, partial [Candidatus Latescibacteria bacterium]|nr:indolepyruvate ferredoxin oxidoreductase subunit alpha [Candidatus Latescibacterota bacterium]
MKKIDERFLQESGIGLFSGNELLLKGGLESEIALITGYPGSPVAEIFDAAESIQDLLLEHGIVAQIANNEALGAARLNGSQMADIRAMAVMKSVGVHVASDALALSNLSGTSQKGGAVAVMGDDPWSEGTQVPADSRMIAQHLYMPTLEPATYQEIKDWIGLAFDLSEKTNLYIAYILTSNQADGGGTITLSPNRYPPINVKHRLTLDTSTISSSDRVVIPPDTAVKEVELVEKRFPTLLRLSREYGVNQMLYSDGKKRAIGFISAGLTYCYLEHALQILGLSGVVPILRLGLSYPVDPVIVREFAERVGAIYVVEEKRGFIEMQVAAILKDLVQQGELSRFELWGKNFSDGLPGIPSTKGLNPSVLVRHLGPILRRIDDPSIPVDRGRIDRELALLNDIETYDVTIPHRTPSFCPGCPHRDSASAIKQIVDQFADPDYMREHHETPPVDLVFHGDIGCYSMLKYEPYGRLMHNLSGMGLGGGTGAGIDSFINNKQVVFMGDSTFFHSGMIAISDSIKNHQDITYIILDNGTTAMTGHQPTPGNDVDIMGRPTFAQDIEEVVSGLTRRHHPSLSHVLRHPIRFLRGSYGADVFIARVNPENRDTYKRLLEKVFLKDGVKVIVADKECGITYHRRLNRERKERIKQTGFLPEERHINITPEVCEYCLECTKATGCTGLTTVETPYG